MSSVFLGLGLHIPAAGTELPYRPHRRRLLQSHRTHSMARVLQMQEQCVASDGPIWRG